MWLRFSWLIVSMPTIYSPTVSTTCQLRILNAYITSKFSSFNNRKDAFIIAVISNSMNNVFFFFSAIFWHLNEVNFFVTGPTFSSFIKLHFYEHTNKQFQSQNIHLLFTHTTHTQLFNAISIKIPKFNKNKIIVPKVDFVAQSLYKVFSL